MSHEVRIEVSAAHNPAATPVNGQYPVSIIRKQLLASELYPDNQRYNPTTGEVEYTPDGGATWISAPELDPRNQTNVPPRTGSDVPCQSAGSAVEYIKRYITLVVTMLQAGSLIVQLATATVAFLKVISGGYAILWELITSAVTTLAGFGATVIGNAFDDTVYHEIACILQCHMDANGQLNETSLGLAQAQITADIGGTAGDVTNLILSIMGFAGVNKAATFYNVDEDCSDCSSCGWCYEWDLTQSDGGWLVIDFGVYVPGVGWQTSYGVVGGASYRACNVQHGILTSATVTHFEATYTRTLGGNNSGAEGRGTVLRWGSNLAATTIASQPASAGNGLLTIAWDGTLTGKDKYLFVSTVGFDSINPLTDQGGQITLTHILMRGTGDNPFGANNC